jgi:hypothetical protein
VPPRKIFCLIALTMLQVRPSSLRSRLATLACGGARGWVVRWVNDAGSRPLRRPSVSQRRSLVTLSGRIFVSRAVYAVEQVLAARAVIGSTKPCGSRRLNSPTRSVVASPPGAIGTTSLQHGSWPQRVQPDQCCCTRLGKPRLPPVRRIELGLVSLI